MKSIIFVCTGNICRSAVAKAYFERKIENLNIKEDFFIDSCGIYATNGRKVSNTTVEVMKEFGIDISNHLAKNICNINLTKYNIILTMTNEQKLNILSIYRKLRGKVFTLKEYINKNYGEYIDIDDPWGLDYEVHKYTYIEIMESIDKLIEKLRM